MPWRLRQQAPAVEAQSRCICAVKRKNECVIIFRNIHKLFCSKTASVCNCSGGCEGRTPAAKAHAKPGCAIIRPNDVFPAFHGMGAVYPLAVICFTGARATDAKGRGGVFLAGSPCRSRPLYVDDRGRVFSAQNGVPSGILPLLKCLVGLPPSLAAWPVPASPPQTPDRFQKSCHQHRPAVWIYYKFHKETGCAANPKLWRKPSGFANGAKARLWRK